MAPVNRYGGSREEILVQLNESWLATLSGVGTETRGDVRLSLKEKAKDRKRNLT